jgi:hypothetical protein
MLYPHRLISSEKYTRIDSWSNFAFRYNIIIIIIISSFYLLWDIIKRRHFVITAVLNHVFVLVSRMKLRDLLPLQIDRAMF